MRSMRGVLPALFVALFLGATATFAGGVGQIEGVVRQLLGSSSFRQEVGIPQATRYHCALRRNGVEATVNDTAEDVLWDSEISDTAGMHSTGVNPGRITIPTGGDGVYQINVKIDWYSNTTGKRRIHLLYYDASDVLLDSAIFHVTGQTGDVTYGFTHGASHSYPLVATNYIRVSVAQTSTGALNFQGGANPELTSVTVTRMSP